MACAGCTFKIKNTDIDLNNYEKLNTYDWLEDMPDTSNLSDIVEVKFKNTRKEFYRNTLGLNIKHGDLITVQMSPGFDMGIVSLRGRMAEMQFDRKAIDTDRNSLRTIYRKSTQNDIILFKESKKLEDPALIKSRQIARDIGLEMKISDVEVQADKTKAYFYYIAENRVDFRELIKVLASTLQLKIEMRQIGSRQESGRIGGIGSCGRELCCSSWRTSLPSVKTTAAQTQNLSSNAEKLTGQCGKLKCCLMYELDTYIEAEKEIPDELLELELKHGIVYPVKIDVLKKTIWYSPKTKVPTTPIEVSLQRVKDIIMLNKKGEKPDAL